MAKGERGERCGRRVGSKAQKRAAPRPPPLCPPASPPTLCPANPATLPTCAARPGPAFHYPPTCAAPAPRPPRRRAARRRSCRRRARPPGRRSLTSARRGWTRPRPVVWGGGFGWAISGFGRVRSWDGPLWGRLPPKGIPHSSRPPTCLLLPKTSPRTKPSPHPQTCRYTGCWLRTMPMKSHGTTRP